MIKLTEIKERLNLNNQEYQYRIWGRILKKNGIVKYNDKLKHMNILYVLWLRKRDTNWINIIESYDIHMRLYKIISIYAKKINFL